MLRTYSQSEMLALWRRALGLETTVMGVDVETFEGIDCSTAIIDRMRRWYLGLLDTADPRLLPLESLSLTPSRNGRAVMAGVVLPADVRRVVWVNCPGWCRGVAPVSPVLAERRLGRLASPYACPADGEPLAVSLPGRVEVAPWTQGAIELLVVREPAADRYVLDDSLLPGAGEMK